MYNRFRELEQAPDGRRLDVVLMAAITGFEELTRPTRRDLKQFAELFAPLFSQASPAARRTAVAALSRCPAMPAEIVEMIVCEEMDVCAPFLANSPALADEQITRIIAGSGPTHARALARRRALSPRIVAALAETGDAAVLRSLKVRRLLPANFDRDDFEAAPATDGSEGLREQLRALVRGSIATAPAPERRPFLKAASPAVAARLRRFAEEQEPVYFTTALADALGSSFQLAERIMLDVYGGQLAETLTALGIGEEVSRVALEAFFPHLRRQMSDGPLSQLLLSECNPEEASERVTLWLRADHDPAAAPEHLPQVVETRPATRDSHPRRSLPYSMGHRKTEGVSKRRADGNGP
ncbi:MAG TPA: DUF2336 domain-containing protein [Pararhizobium sp.]|nr:DUF2336 domain-containing protein [Pararhizobium sp.]